EEVYPPQPMASQIEYVLAAYGSKGGKVYREQIPDCGHTPFIEKPEITRQALLNHIQKEPAGNKNF
ncbi:MAG: alpha/beta fold hydrolase, partial [Bacteroidota bacterium]